MYSSGASMVWWTTRVISRASARFCASVRPSRMSHWMIGIRSVYLPAMLLFLLIAARTFVIDGSASTATAHLGKTGIGSFAGHEHNVDARTIQGEIVLDAEDLTKSSVYRIVDARSLKLREEGQPEGDAPKL